MTTTIDNLDVNVLSVVVAQSTPGMVGIMSMVCRVFHEAVSLHFQIARRKRPSAIGCMLDLVRSKLASAVKWAYTMGCPMPYNASALFAATGQLDLLCWWHQQMGDRRRHDYVSTTCTSVWWTAVHHGHLDVVVWLRSMPQCFAPSPIVVAAARGHLNILRWERSQGRRMTADAFHAAVINGHARVVEWLVDIGCPYRGRPCVTAARYGHNAVIAVLCAREFMLDATVCRGAAKGGQLGTLWWLREIGCPWDARTCQAAAKHGHLDVLVWAYANGCPLDRDACYVCAVGAGHHAVADWIDSLGRA
ncbi:Ankyrin repeat domain containing protein [Pandoravirus quercus]|uniref:Ankyrin repeat domain containing protein n=2 Tax=Pandoravirus TaxID=2060084 RepID=A0A2U7U9H7_9VIRU|nr:Ankyrin repeat domain containing protein [Pandoravirus quercus]AVK75030.1 Ankyrin repeat domain containing protein [Pandoravirus quercus]QBZ81218.1 ankyrin repeat domain containing protein [Pandoravirus celtis]